MEERGAGEDPAAAEVLVLGPDFTVPVPLHGQDPATPPPPSRPPPAHHPRSPPRVVRTRPGLEGTSLRAGVPAWALPSQLSGRDRVRPEVEGGRAGNASGTARRSPPRRRPGSRRRGSSIHRRRKARGREFGGHHDVACLGVPAVDGRHAVDAVEELRPAVHEEDAPGKPGGEAHLLAGGESGRPWRSMSAGRLPFRRGPMIDASTHPICDTPARMVPLRPAWVRSQRFARWVSLVLVPGLRRGRGGFWRRRCDHRRQRLLGRRGLGDRPSVCP